MAEALRVGLKGAITERTWPVYLFGPAGRGKTYAMAAFYMRWPQSSKPPLWVDLQPWLSLVMKARRDGFASRKSRLDGEWRDVTEKFLLTEVDEASLVCIDDCGVRGDSDAQQSALLEVLNLRQGKPTIITGNHEPAVLHKVFDSRIASRLMSGVMFKLTGIDRRMVGTKIIEVET